MSEFIDKLESELTGIRHPWREKLPALTAGVIEEYSHAAPISTMHEYRFHVQWEVFAKCRPADLGPMKKNVIMTMRKAIYGDLADIASRAQHALYENDYTAAINAISDLFVEIEGRKR